MNVSVEDNDNIKVLLCGLRTQYKPFATFIQTRKNLPSFLDLVSMLIMEEKSMGISSLQSNKNLELQVFYSNTSRGCGQDYNHGENGSGHLGNQQQNQNSNNQQNNFGDDRGQFRDRGIQRGQGFQRQQSDVVCHYCGRKGHMQGSCYRR